MGLFANLKTNFKKRGDKKQDGEQQFTIQPHPAKDNNPASLQPGNGSQLAPGVTSAPGPQVLSNETANSLEQPLSHEELQKRANELNQ